MCCTAYLLPRLYPCSLSLCLRVREFDFLYCPPLTVAANSNVSCEKVLCLPAADSRLQRLTSVSPALRAVQQPQSSRRRSAWSSQTITYRISAWRFLLLGLCFVPCTQAWWLQCLQFSSWETIHYSSTPHSNRTACWFLSQSQASILSPPRTFTASAGICVRPPCTCLSASPSLQVLHRKVP